MACTEVAFRALDRNVLICVESIALAGPWVCTVKELFMAKRKSRDTRYVNTDLDLKSSSPFECLIRELEMSCTVLHYTHGEDGHWHSIVESSYPEEEHSKDRNGAMDIRLILDNLKGLSSQARLELQNCYMKEFNMGFDCWDTWSYVHSLPVDILRQAAELSCTIAVTLYPMRDTDGKPRD